MANTTISTQDIRDKAVTSAKIQDNPSIPQITTDRIRTSSNYISFYGPASAGKPIATTKLIVSGVYASGYSNLPTPEGSAYIAGDMRIDGNLTINGTTTTINTATLNVSDNIIMLNNDVTGSPTENAGIEVQRGTSSNASLRWNETDDYWDLTNNGTNFYRIVDENYGDGRYAKINGNNFTGNVGIGVTTPLAPLHIASTTPDIYLCGSTTNQVDSGTIRFLEHSSAGNYQGAFIQYDGSANAFYIGTHEAADLSLASDINALTITRSTGDVTFVGNISMGANKTVDGVDISSHHANGITNVKHVTDAMQSALAGTSGTPGAANKYVTNSDSRLSDARTAIVHGDEKHNALSYYNSINGKAASSTLKSILISGIGGTTVTTTNDATYAAKITIDSSHNHDGTYVKLASGSEQVIKSNITIGESGAHKNLVINGNLTIAGTATYVNTETLNIYDNILTLNSNYSGSTPTEDAGIEVERGTLSNVSLFWNETNDYWSLTNDGSTYYRIIDQGYGDSRYLNVTGGTLTGRLNLKGNGFNQALSFYSPSFYTWFEYATQAGAANACTGGTAPNYGNVTGLTRRSTIENQAGYGWIWDSCVNTANANPDPKMSLSSADGSLRVKGTITTEGDIVLSTANAKVDGRDVSVDGSKLDALETIRSKRSRSTTTTISAFAQDTSYTMTQLGLSTISWGSANIVLVIIDGQVNAPGLDYILGATNTITFKYDIPTDTVIDIIVL